MMNTAHAAVYKCKTAGAKITISDLPCENILPSQPSMFDSVNPRAQEKTPRQEKVKEKAQSLKNETQTQGDSLEERILAGHTMECRAWRQELSQQGQIKEGALLGSFRAKKESVGAKYEASCLTRANDITVLYLAQKESAKFEAARKVTCEAKARDYQKRQDSKAVMTEKQATELAFLASELARGCR